MTATDVFLGDVFTFEVGASKERFIIHKRAIEPHSQALTTLMNNGVMQESTQGVAWLEHVDPTVFRLFVEYVYTGIYRIEPSGTSNLAVSSSAVPQKYLVSCAACADREVEVLPFDRPASCPKCGTRSIDVYSMKDKTCIIQQKRHYNCLENVGKWSAKCEFRNLEYPALGRDHQSLKEHLRGLRPQDKVTTKVSIHAMLYIFAQEYMVDSLMKLCLHKLHRDLMFVEINVVTVEEIVKTLSCVYENTSGSDDKRKMSSSEIGVGQRLRNLVLSYAVWNAKQLLKFDSFGAMLQGGGDVIDDFLKGLSDRLSS